MTLDTFLYVLAQWLFTEPLNEPLTLRHVARFVRHLAKYRQLPEAYGLIDTVLGPD